MRNRSRRIGLAVVALAYFSVFRANCLADPASCIAKPAGLVSWWRGEGDATDSVGTNNGVLLGSVTFTNGMVGQGFLLNGNGAYIRVPHSPSLNFTTELTIELWFKNLRSDFYVYGLIANRASETGPCNFGINATPDGIGPYYSDPILGSGGSDPLSSFQTSRYLPLPSVLAWHHFAVTYKQSGSSTVVMNTFIDGQLVRSQPTAGNLANTVTTFPVTIGSSIEYPNFEYFNGIIDEVSLYNRALGTNEIQGIYAAGSAGKCASSTCVPAPSGLVSLWRAEGNANDSVDGNNGTLVNGANFAPGESGNAFNLNGINQYVLVTTPNLNVGVGSGMTIEGWINPTTVNVHLPIFEYERALGSGSNPDVGAHLHVSAGPPGEFYANLVDTSGGYHIFRSDPGLVVAGAWQHIALSYDKSSGHAAIYLNGSVVLQTNFGSFNVQTSFTNFVIGARTTFGSASSPNDRFAGEIDELSVYSRSLSAGEIQAIYAAGSAGKCAPVTNQPPVPVITVSPFAKFPGNTNVIVISRNGVNAAVTFDGSKSYDPDGTNILFSWSEGTSVFSTKAVVTEVLPLGTHVITLKVDDTLPQGTSSASVTVDVITASEAVGLIMETVQDSNLARRTEQPLIATLLVAVHLFDRGQITAGLNLLQAFENKVRALVAPFDPALAKDLISAAGAVQEAFNTTPHVRGGPGKPAVSNSAE